MIRILRKNDIASLPELFDVMFQARAKVFADKRGWNLYVQDGREIDFFDRAADPVYIVAHDEAGRHKGSLRMLSSAGPTPMGSCYGQQFDQEIPRGNPAIWECSRFLVDQEAGARQPIASALLITLCEWALSSDVEFILGSFELSMDRIYRRIGWSPTIYARSQTDPRHLVGLWEATPKDLRRMCQKAGTSANEGVISDFLARNAKDDIWVKGRNFK